MAEPGTPGAASVAGSSQAPGQGKQLMIYICGGKVPHLLVVDADVSQSLLCLVPRQSATVRMRFVRGTPSGAESVAIASCTRNEQKGVS